MTRDLLYSRLQAGHSKARQGNTGCGAEARHEVRLAVTLCVALTAHDALCCNAP